MNADPADQGIEGPDACPVEAFGTSAEGSPQKAEVRTSSGYERLDATAVATALRYRFRPGTRGGMPEAMWVNVPFDFKLD